MYKTNSEDLYIYNYMNKEDDSVEMGIANNLEELQHILKMDDLIVISFQNITGKNIQFGEMNILHSLVRK